VVLSSHLLDEVERTCDAVAIVDRGKVIRQGPISELLAGSSFEVQVECSDPDRAAPARRDALRRARSRYRPGRARHLAPRGHDRDAIAEINRLLVEGGISVYRLQHIQASLESWFLEVTSDWGKPNDDRLRRRRTGTRPGSHLRWRRAAAERSPRLVDPDLGHGHHALSWSCASGGADDRADRRQHRHPGRLPRRASHFARRRPEVLRAGRRLQHLHHAGGRLHVRLRVRRGGRRRLHGGVGRPHRGDVPPPGDHRPLPVGPVLRPHPGRAGHRHRHGGGRLHHRLRRLRLRRADAAQLRRRQRPRGLSRPALDTWAAAHADEVICNFNFHGGRG
jgi:hypothetical protein